MKKVPKKEDFGFEKVHILNGKVTVNANPVTYIEGIPYTSKMAGDEYTMTPHEDLTSEIEKLKTPLAKLHGLIDVETLVMSKEFGATKEQKEASKKHTSLKMSEIKVTGIKVTGEDQSRKLTITGTYKGMAINTRGQKLTGGEDGLFDDETTNIVDKIIDETYKYIFEEKIVNPEPLNGGSNIADEG